MHAKIENDKHTVELMMSTFSVIDAGKYYSGLHHNFYPDSLFGLQITSNTTPMYRTPEMLDLYQNFPINEALDIWVSILLEASLQFDIRKKWLYFYRTCLLLHLLIAGCDIGVQISVRPFVRPCVRSFVRQHLRRSLVFTTSEIAASLKPCIVIVPDIPFKHAP